MIIITLYYTSADGMVTERLLLLTLPAVWPGPMWVVCWLLISACWVQHSSRWRELPRKT